MLDECPVVRYNPIIPLPPDGCDDGCRRSIPVNGSCQLAQELFFSTPTDTCQHQLKIDICQITDVEKPFIEPGSSIQNVFQHDSRNTEDLCWALRWQIQNGGSKMADGKKIIHFLMEKIKKLYNRMAIMW